MLQFQLSPQQKELQARVREFAVKELLPAVWHYDDKGEIPLFLLQKAFDAGFMNTDIPMKYGGKGFGLMENVILTEEISAVCAGLATSIFDNSLGMVPIFLGENEKLREKYLPVIAREFKRICFATSEPTMGSDVAGIRCRAGPKAQRVGAVPAAHIVSDMARYSVKSTLRFVVVGQVGELQSAPAPFQPLLLPRGKTPPGVSVNNSHEGSNRC